MILLPLKILYYEVPLMQYLLSILTSSYPAAVRTLFIIDINLVNMHGYLVLDIYF